MVVRLTGSSCPTSSVDLLLASRIVKGTGVGGLRDFDVGGPYYSSGRTSVPSGSLHPSAYRRWRR